MAALAPGTPETSTWPARQRVVVLLDQPPSAVDVADDPPALRRELVDELGRWPPVMLRVIGPPASPISCAEQIDRPGEVTGFEGRIRHPGKRDRLRGPRRWPVPG